MSEQPIYDGWAILELMGHVRMAGRVTEESHFGVALGRIDIPTNDGYTTQYFGGSSIYRLTPTTEAIARSVALHNQPEPVHRWELPLAALSEKKEAEDIGGPGGSDIYAAAFEENDDDYHEIDDDDD